MCTNVVWSVELRKVELIIPVNLNEHISKSYMKLLQNFYKAWYI